MRIVIALGGNALLRRGEPMTVANQRAAVARMGAALSPLLGGHEIVVSHGNGPQVGLLALQAAAYDEVSGYPFDVLGAQTEGMIGYLIEQELRNRCGASRAVATLLTMTEVAADDPAFSAPTKFVGPVYFEEEARDLALANGWSVARDGNRWRRTIASPTPLRIIERRAVEWLLDRHAVVVCGGGGGIPVVRNAATGRLVGVEAVVDKDRTSAVLARDIGADLLVMATDADGVADGWGTDHARFIRGAHPDALDAGAFEAGSMRPKVEAAISFVQQTSGEAVIGSLDQIGKLVAGTAGTRITRQADDVVFWPTELREAVG
jgi:carbamate kinase